ncbi:branched-chain amino acid transport system ATP-binding protein [Herbaspirillum sp. Sphag1AN]|uniref:ABC transporter ATP-binding protein n=1 Tax=unclassified Herbaspirillum TaxID=2624150 RepID=UPI00160F01C2|nr:MULTISPECIES: ABC transporter ATP-binding protein [unclassified Herbaspirillum]MBB3213842.1 branched-chain amino acid transport system ATP-binding protein [Herbaspirillum sp. Sphag1AN]MBB3247039.1 branched-chain amino acid transport system ATP-binding protein [Herbaspirillum sp. Sphag64]
MNTVVDTNTAADTIAAPAPAATPAHLELQQVSLNYGQVRALQDVSLRVDTGSVVALIGANGAGKSSTLRAITGLSSVHQGQVLLNGSNVTGTPAHKLVEMGVAMVPEGRHVFPFMSIKDNLLMGAYTRADKGGIAADLERVLTRFPRLKERFSQQASSLSGGEQQMVAIGRALMAKPRLLLLDEPSLGIAPQFIRQIARTILEINRDDGVTIMLVEQNSRMALMISHYAYILATGRIELEGASRSLLDHPDIKRLYLGA